MPREKLSYRDNLEMLTRKYPDRIMLSISEVAQATGYSKQYTGRRFKFDGRRIAITELAKQLS